LNDEDRERLIRIEAKLKQTQWLILYCFCSVLVVIFCQNALPEADWMTWLLGRAAIVALATGLMMYAAKLIGVHWRP
jgi:hypothetical protein